MHHEESLYGSATLPFVDAAAYFLMVASVMVGC